MKYILWGAGWLFLCFGVIGVSFSLYCLVRELRIRLYKNCLNCEYWFTGDLIPKMGRCRKTALISKRIYNCVHFREDLKKIRSKSNG